MTSVFLPCEVLFHQFFIFSFLLKLLELSTSMLVRLVLVMIVAPIFTGAVVIFGAISGLYARAYMKAQLPVKREQSKTRAPLIGHLNTTVASLGMCQPHLCPYVVTHSPR